MTTTFQMRIDSKVKSRAQKAFKKAGIDLSTGVRLYLNEVAKSKNVVVKTANGFTPEQERRALKEMEHAIKYGKRYNSTKELFADLMK